MKEDVIAANLANLRQSVNELREFGIRKSSKEFRLCHSFRIYGQSIRLVVKEAISSECGAEVDHEVVH